MSTLMQASQQWATRPADERFTSLHDMADHFRAVREHSRAAIVPSRRILAKPHEDNKGLEIVGPNGNGYYPTNWAFGQIAQLAGAPAGYLRTLPSPIVADCLNYGLQYKRDVEDIGILLYRNGQPLVTAATGPNYGRIWNAEIVKHLISRFGDGVTGEWRVPGEFGKRLVSACGRHDNHEPHSFFEGESGSEIVCNGQAVTKDNTTLFAGDRDMFVFLCDEDHRIENPAREGEPMARGFFVWNSEVGSKTFGMATFLFDYVCCNRIVWGASEYKEITIRHTSSAPDKYMDEMRPALESYANSSARTITAALQAAKQARLDPAPGGELDSFLKNRFGVRIADRIKEVHKNEEGRPIETLWDVVTGATAYARGIKYQDDRVDMERKAGEVLDLAAKRAS